MSESADHSRAAPRFPYVAALLCAACVGAAAWLWMEHSYATGITPKEMKAGWKRNADDLWGSTHPLLGRYVKLRGISTGKVWTHPYGRSYLFVDDPTDEREEAQVCISQGQTADRGAAVSFAGRVAFHDRCCGCGQGLFVTVDTTASRFTGASVAGLVVGAMGVFVFAVAFRDWLGECRAPEADPTATPPESLA